MSVLPFRRNREEAATEGGWCDLVFDHALPSRVPGVPFETRFNASWRRTEPDSASESRIAEALARELLRSVATVVSQQCEPGDRSSVADRLTVACAGPLRSAGDPGIEVRAEIMIRESHRHHAVIAHIACEQRAEYLRNWRTDARVTALAALLGNRATAYAWWLQHAPDKIEHLEDGKIRGVSDVIASAPGRFGDRTADALSSTVIQFVSRLSVDDQRVLLGRLPDFLKAYGHADLADELREEAPVRR